MTANIYGTKITDYFAQRIASLVAQVPSPPPLINFVDGVLRVGDGNGAVPSLSTLLQRGSLVNEVWFGETIVGVALDPERPKQIKITCVIPAAVGGVEIGPFTIREFAIYDETGNLCLVGVTSIQKTTSEQGQPFSLTFNAYAAVSSTDPIIITDPQADYVKSIDVRNLVNANRATAESPIEIFETVTPTGWIRQLFKILRATTAQLGVGRAATDAEFAAGQPASGGFQFPWVTIQQVKSIVIPARPGVALPLTYDEGNNRYGAQVANGGVIRGGASNSHVITPTGLVAAAPLIVLPDQASVPWDMATGWNARLILSANRTLAAPSNAVEGWTYELFVSRNNAGAGSLAYHSAYDWGAAGAPSLPAGANGALLISMKCVQGGVSPRLLCSVVGAY